MGKGWYETYYGQEIKTDVDLSTVVYSFCYEDIVAIAGDRCEEALAEKGMSLDTLANDAGLLSEIGRKFSDTWLGWDDCMTMIIDEVLSRQ